MKLKNMFHLGISHKHVDNANLAIVPGDPNRVKKIAETMNNPSYLASYREFVIWRAYLSNKAIIICSTGIGGSSTSIVIEELSQLGIRTFLRVGTTGAIQDYVKIGDNLIINAAIRLDGASQHFAPLEFPAVADFFCTAALVQAAKKIGKKFHIGITVSSDTFYPGQERYDTYSKYIIKSLRGSMKEWQHMGAISYEMESATLLTMCMVQGLHAGVVTGVIVNRIYNEIPKIETIKCIENNTINIVVEAARILLYEQQDIILQNIY